MEPSLFNWCQIICEFVFLFFLFALFCDIIGITYRKVRKREKKPLNISLFFSSNKPAVHYIVIAVLLVPSANPQEFQCLLLRFLAHAQFISL